MSEAQWAPYGDALKLILTGSTTKPLTLDQRGIFENMLACGMRDEEGDRAAERLLTKVRTQPYCLNEVTQEHETMYYIPDLFMYMVTAFRDWDTPAPPVDLAYLKRMLKDTEENDDLKMVLRKIEIQQEIAALDRTHHGRDPVKLEARSRVRKQLEAELAEFSEQIIAAHRTRDMDLQDAANALAAQWRGDNRIVFSKREIAKELAKSDVWKDMTAIRIERIIRKEW